MENEHRYIKQKELERLTGLSRSTINRYRATGKINYIQTGSGCTILYDIKDVEQFLNKFNSKNIQ